MGICELLIDEKMFAKYRWCGNGRPPSSRISLFKAYILKAMRNYPYTKTLIAAVRESPTVRRLCGWESVADIPDKSQFSRAFKAFAKDDVGSKTLAACLAEDLGRNGVMHGSHDSSSIRAVCQLEHLRIQIYTIYTFYTAIKEGFATASTEKIPAHAMSQAAILRWPCHPSMSAFHAPQVP